MGAVQDRETLFGGVQEYGLLVFRGHFRGSPFSGNTEKNPTRFDTSDFQYVLNLNRVFRSLVGSWPPPQEALVIAVSPLNTM